VTHNGHGIFCTHRPSTGDRPTRPHDTRPHGRVFVVLGWWLQCAHRPCRVPPMNTHNTTTAHLPACDYCGSTDPAAMSTGWTSHGDHSTWTPPICATTTIVSTTTMRHSQPPTCTGGRGQARTPSRPPHGAHAPPPHGGGVVVFGSVGRVGGSGRIGTHTGAHGHEHGHGHPHGGHGHRRAHTGAHGHGHPHGHPHPHPTDTPTGTHPHTHPHTGAHGTMYPHPHPHGAPHARPRHTGAQRLMRARPPAMRARHARPPSPVGNLWTTCGQPSEEPRDGLWTTCGQSYPQLWISPADFFRGSGLRWVAPRQPYYNFQIEQSEISIRPT
jgi:hypothetical protein